jgi:GGDEF domain-containing protein
MRCSRECAVISIRKSVDDLERLDELKKREDLSGAILDCYTQAIHSSSHYVVEVDASLALEFRTHLKVIEEQSRSAASIDQLRRVQSSFRGELREYRDKSVQQLTKMRQEMESATNAMIIFADTVAFNGVNHEQEVQAQLRGLESTTQITSLNEIRGNINTAVTGIESSVQRMQRDNQLVIAQLQDEIRVLHQQIELERKALYTDQASGAWNRPKLETHIDNLLRQNQPFCLLLVCVRNLKRIESQYSRTVVEGTLKALILRFAAIAGEDPLIGRWTEDQFVAILDLPAAEALPLSAEATRKLSGPYAVQENGLAQKVIVQAAAGVIDRAPNADPSAFRRKLEQLAAAISGA